jgi:hypothetical protein
LELFRADTRLFCSTGRWLYPLVELEDYLQQSAWSEADKRGELRVRDKIVGKAAALLLVRLGIRTVHADLLSSLGQAALESHGVALSYGQRVPRIACRTESLLEAVDDLEEAYRLVRERMKRSGP